MQQISNKTLTFLLLIAIIVSITGAIISINRINQLTLQAPIITGMATPSGTGMVNVSVGGVTSITATDAIIQFGSCSPAITYGSNVTSNSTSGGICATGGTYPDNITIKNDGNTDVNVTVETSTLAKDFIGGTIGGAGQAEMWFSVRNSSDYPGCLNASGAAYGFDSGFDTSKGFQYNWKNFSVADFTYLACVNLTYGANTNSFYLFAKLFLPANAPPGANHTTTLTFTATNW